MKSTKYYSLDECSDQDKVFAKLDLLADDRKLEYDFVEADLIKIKDISLTAKEIKELSQFFHANDVIEDKDYGEDEDEDLDDDYGYDDDDY